MRFEKKIYRFCDDIKYNTKTIPGSWQWHLESEISENHNPEN